MVYKYVRFRGLLTIEMKKALIVASGLRGVIGHNFFYTRTVQRELERRGFDVTVFINKQAPASLLDETNYKPIFSLGTYDIVPQNGKRDDLIYTYLQGGIYSYELQSAINTLENKNFDLTFFHTVADFELIGLNRYLKKHKLNGHLFVMQRVTPRFQDCAKWKTVLHPYWRVRPQALNSLYKKMRGRFTLLTDSEILTEDYSHVYKHRIVTFPIPLEGFEPKESLDSLSDTVLTRYNLRRDGRICFGFMGDSRGGKGFYLLPEMIKKVLARDESKKIKFVVQCPNSEYENVGLPTGLKELQELTAQHDDRVFLVREKLSEEDYILLCNYLDVTMLPYTYLPFREGTSNVFAESVSLGKAIVVTNDTWMSHELKKYGGGLDFERNNVDDFAEKVLLVTDNYEEFAKKATDYSATWRGFHNTKNLVDMLLAEIKR